MTLEKHYRVGEIAAAWGLSANTIIRLFTTEPGVIRLESGAQGKRKYVALSIPETVALRVKVRLSFQKPIVHLRNSRPPQKIVKLKDLLPGRKLPPRSAKTD